MNIFLIILDILVISFGNFVLANSFFEIKKNKTWVLYYVFFFLFVVPVILDRLYAFPSYELGFRYGYVIMGTDPLVTILYDIIIMFICFVFYYFLNFRYKVAEQKENKPFIGNKYLKIVLFGATIFPILMFLVACVVSKRSPFMIFDLGWKYKYEEGKLGGEIFAYSAIERLTYIAVTCCLLLITSVDFKKLFKKKRKVGRDKKLIILTFIMLAFLGISLLINMFLEGKRSIYLFAGIVLFITLYYKVLGKVKPWIAIVSFVAFFGIALVVVFVLGDLFRTASAYGEGFTPYKYTSLRVDFFRDQSLKYVIYTLLHSKEVQVVSFPMQSYLTEIFYLFPIVYLPISFKKGYETYLTASYSFMDASSLGTMRITNSGLDEMCANFSFFGVVIFVLALVYLIRTMSRLSDDKNVLVMVAFVLFMMYTTSYICWYYEFLAGFLILEKVLKYLDKKKKRRVRKHAKVLKNA